MGAWCVGIHLTDLKMWLFARSEEGKKYLKKHVKKLGKSLHITNCKTFFQYLDDLVSEILKYKASLFQLFMYDLVLLLIDFVFVAQV